MHDDGTDALKQGQVPAARSETSGFVNFPDENTLTRSDCLSPSDEAAERRLAKLIRSYWLKAGFDIAVEVVPRDGSDLGAGGMPNRPAVRPPATGDAPTRRRRR